MKGAGWGNGFEKRIIEFFVKNQGEELTYSDICTKFDVDYRYAKNVVCKLKRAGLLEAVVVVRFVPSGEPQK